MLYGVSLEEVYGGAVCFSVCRSIPYVLMVCYRVMLYVSTMIEGADEEARIIRRTLMRYLTLGSLIVFQATSVRIKKRFPTMDHLVEAGECLLT